MKKTFIFSILVATLAFAGVAYAASVNNFFDRTTPGTKDNVLNLNGTVEVEDVRVAAKATFVVGTEATNAITVAVTFKDGNDVAVAAPVATVCYLANDAAGLDVHATAGTSANDNGTDGDVKDLVSGLVALVVSEATGELDFKVTSTGTPTYYLACRMPQGTLSVSGAITFA